MAKKQTIITKKVSHPPIPKMPSGTGESKRKLPKRKVDRTGSASRSRYETNKASTPT